MKVIKKESLAPDTNAIRVRTKRILEDPVNIKVKIERKTQNSPSLFGLLKKDLTRNT